MITNKSGSIRKRIKANEVSRKKNATKRGGERGCRTTPLPTATLHLSLLVSRGKNKL